MSAPSEKSALLGREAAAEPRGLYQTSRRRSVIVLWSTIISLVWCYLVLSTLLIDDDEDGWFKGGKKHHKHKHHKVADDVCLEAECVHAASELLYNMSPDHASIDACTNFEELVCGGWKDRHDLRPDQGDAFTGTIMAENSQTLNRHILEASYPKDSAHSYFSPMQLAKVLKSPDESNFEKMKAAYDACMDEGKIAEVGTGPLMEVINHVKELFPADADVSSRAESLHGAILYLYQMGVTALVAPFTSADDKDPDTVIVAITPPQSMGLPAKELYQDDKVVGKYKGVISDVFGGLLPSLDAQAVGDDIADFEKKLAEAAPKEEDANDVTKYYNPMSLQQASELLPQVDLATMINKLAPMGVAVDRVINMSPSYMNKTRSIVAATDNSVLQNYLIWKVVQSFYSFVDADAVKPYKRFINELQGRDPDSAPERWRTCVRHVDGGLGWILSRFFVEKAFSAKAKEFGDQMVTDIKTEFIKKLKQTKWMEKSVQNLAIDKVHNIIQKIGYPTNVSV